MDYNIISCDDHLDMQFLPPDLWTSRLPDQFKDRAPQVEERDGKAVWMCEGKPIASFYGEINGNLYPLKISSLKTALDRGGHIANTERRPAISSLRLHDMDRDGVYAQVIYGPITSLDSEDVEFRQALYVAYNDWLRDFCSAAPDRLIGVRMLPPAPEGATAEILRLAKQGGTKQANLQVGVVKTPLRDPSWEPFWQAVEETGIILSFHVVLIPGKPAPGPEAAAFEFMQGPKSQIEQQITPFLEMIGGGILERHPKIRLIMAESGAGWMPWLVQDLDHRYGQLTECAEHWEAHGGFPMKMKPSEVFKRQIYCSFQDDEAAVTLMRFFGDGNLLWASDYPHPDSTWPNSHAAIERQMSTISPESRRKLLHDNAAALYGLQDEARIKAA